jgi:hypothetical protein|tara:strand:- start:187 stop:711 length:525 start_codon:yes stop_codon:yes gene_type:complete
MLFAPVNFRAKFQSKEVTMTEPRTSMNDDQPEKSEGVTLDMTALQKFANDKAELTIREAQLKRDKAQLRKDESVVLEALSHSGVPKISVNTEDGPRTLYVRREMYASVKPGVEPEAAMAVLDELDLADFHKQRITLPSVSAWLREKHDAHEEIPEPIKAVFNAEPVFRVGVTKS